MPGVRITRATFSRLLPTVLKRRLRPLLVPWLYRLEQPQLRRLLATMVPPGALVFDIGAAEGFVTEVMVGLGARVIAVEPQPYCVEVLRRRFAREEAVTIVAAGVSEREGELPFHVCPGDPELSTFALDRWSRGRYRGRRWSPPVPVSVLTLDHLVACHGAPAFVKIDVEGYEPEVLAGLSTPVQALSFEFTRELLDATRRCCELLDALGPTRYNLSLFRRHRLLCSSWMSAERLVETIETHPDRDLQGDVYARLGHHSG